MPLFVGLVQRLQADVSVQGSVRFQLLGSPLDFRQHTASFACSEIVGVQTNSACCVKIAMAAGTEAAISGCVWAVTSLL